MTTCKKKVYKTMCETDNGIRHGKYKRTKYVSARKGQRLTSTRKARK